MMIQCRLNQEQPEVVMWNVRFPEDLVILWRVVKEFSSKIIRCDRRFQRSTRIYQGWFVVV